VRRQAERFPGDKLSTLRDCGYLDTFSTLDYYDESILHDLMQILSGYPDFDHLTSREYDLELREGMCSDDDDDDDENDNSEPDPHCYSKESQQELLQWRPANWWIPSYGDLAAVSKLFLPRPGYFGFTTEPDEVTTKKHSSATAVAIRFLDQLTPTMRRHVRNIVIHEDNPSVAWPKMHTLDLIPFCVANPDLQIERRVDIYRTELVQQSQPHGWVEEARVIITNIAEWIQEAKVLQQMGMPAESFSLVLHGPSKKS
jgi:hypothetical protein